MTVPLRHALERHVEELDAAYEEGQIVEHENEGAGVIAAVITSDTEWEPTDGDVVEIDASEDNPVYVVALMDGGSVPAEASDLEDGPDELPGDGVDLDKSDEVEMAPVYEYCDDPSKMSELLDAKRTHILKNNKAELASYADSDEVTDTYVAWHSMDVDELLNIPGVDDPEVGFASDPNGWDRTSYLDAWVTVGASWYSCYARMLRHFGPRMTKRWCSALKDEILGTEEWRGWDD